MYRKRVLHHSSENVQVYEFVPERETVFPYRARWKKLVETKAKPGATTPHASERRSTVRARDNRDFVAATEIPAISAIFLIGIS